MVNNRGGKSSINPSFLSSIGVDEGGSDVALCLSVVVFESVCVMGTLVLVSDLLLAVCLRDFLLEVWMRDTHYE